MTQVSHRSASRERVGTATRTVQNGRETLAKPEDVSAYTGESLATLANRRFRGTGPKFVYLGRSVRYRWSDVDAWLDANTRTQTGD